LVVGTRAAEFAVARTAAFVLGLAAVSLGCSRAAAGDLPDAGGGGRVCTPGAPFDVTGRAGVLGILNVHVNASGLVETDTTAALLLLLDIEQKGTAVAVKARVCDLEIPEVPISGQDRPIRFTLGAGLLDSVPEVAGTATLGGTTTCATFTSAPITVTIGARMSPPTGGTLPEANAMGQFSECLPAASSCEAAITNNCVCDQELDHKPGATLLAENVPVVSLKEVYVNLRTTFSLAGAVFSSDEIEGEVTAQLEQGILACAKVGGGACSAAEVGAVKNLNPDIEQNAEPSTFRAVRVAADLDCAGLKARRSELFPP
jgi:hypothetical protein